MVAGPHAGDPIYAATTTEIYVSHALGRIWTAVPLSAIPLTYTPPQGL